MNTNKIFLAGFVGGDAESKLVGDISCTKFNLCTDDGYFNKQKNEWVSQPNWHNIIVWRKLSEDVAQHIKKGDCVTLEGKLTCRSYETTEGEKRRAYEVVAHKLAQIKIKPKNQGAFPTSAPQTGGTLNTPIKVNNGQPEAPEDDLPF